MSLLLGNTNSFACVFKENEFERFQNTHIQKYTRQTKRNNDIQ